MFYQSVDKINCVPTIIELSFHYNMHNKQVEGFFSFSQKKQVSFKESILCIFFHKVLDKPPPNDQSVDWCKHIVQNNVEKIVLEDRSRACRNAPTDLPRERLAIDIRVRPPPVVG